MSEKYATIEIPGAMSFTAISKDLEKDGINLTPARTRLILLGALEKIVRKLGIKYGCPMNRETASIIVKESDFQNNIAPFIQAAYGQQY